MTFEDRIALLPPREQRRVIRRGTKSLQCEQCGDVSSNWTAFEILWEHTEGCFYTPAFWFRVCFHVCGHHQDNSGLPIW